MPEQRLDVQWCRGWGTGVRTWAAQGVTRAHRRDPDRPDFTLCGVEIERRTGLHVNPTSEEAEAERCRRCAGRMQPSSSGRSIEAVDTKRARDADTSGPDDTGSEPDAPAA